MNVKNQLEFLGRHHIDCVIIGGVAATLHGSALPTSDLDVCYARTTSNFEKLAIALQSVHARLRDSPSDLSFRLEAETLRSGLNFTFSSDIGDLDLLGEVQGIGFFDSVSEGAATMSLLGYEFRVISLDKLIMAKRATGRGKDLLAVMELEAIRELKSSQIRD